MLPVAGVVVAGATGAALPPPPAAAELVPAIAAGTAIVPALFALGGVLGLTLTPPVPATTLPVLTSVAAAAPPLPAAEAVLSLEAAADGCDSPAELPQPANTSARPVVIHVLLSTLILLWRGSRADTLAKPVAPD